MRFKIRITETLERIVEVEADSADEAIDEVYDRYDSGDIILDADDFVNRDIEEVEE